MTTIGSMIGVAAWIVAFAFGVQWGIFVMLGSVGYLMVHACDELGRIKKRLPTSALPLVDDAAAARVDKRRALTLGGVLVAVIGAALFFAFRK